MSLLRAPFEAIRVITLRQRPIGALDHNIFRIVQYAQDGIVVLVRIETGPVSAPCHDAPPLVRKRTMSGFDSIRRKLPTALALTSISQAYTSGGLLSTSR